MQKFTGILFNNLVCKHMSTEQDSPYIPPEIVNKCIGKVSHAATEKKKNLE